MDQTRTKHSFIIIFTLFQKISEFDNDEILKCGDWNFVNDPDRDYDYYLLTNNPRSRQVTLDYMAVHNIFNFCSVMNENRKQFTWRRKKPVRKQTRLDFFLISDPILSWTHRLHLASALIIIASF